MKKIIGGIVGVLIIAIIGGGVFTRNVLYKLKYTKEIKQYAREYNVDPAILAAVIHFENNFMDINEQYTKGEAVGPFNFKDTKVEKYAKEMGLTNFKKEDIANIDTNIKIGAWYISKNFKNNDYKELSVAWLERNKDQDQRMKDYAKQYYAEKIEKRAKMYKIVHPELK